MPSGSAGKHWEIEEGSFLPWRYYDVHYDHLEVVLHLLVGVYVVCGVKPLCIGVADDLPCLQAHHHHVCHHVVALPVDTLQENKSISREMPNYFFFDRAGKNT